MYASAHAEPTVQQEETPQPPPLKPLEGTDGEQPPPAEQEKADITFLISCDSHLGHFVSVSAELVF